MRKPIQLSTIVITLAAIVLFAPCALGQSNPFIVVPTPVLTVLGSSVDTTQYCVARGQPFTLTSTGINDDDAVADPEPEWDDIGSATWRYRHKATPEAEWPGTWSTPPCTPRTLTGGGANWQSSLQWSLSSDGYYQFRLTIDDVPLPERKEDPSDDAIKQFEVRGVDYVVVQPDVVEFVTGACMPYQAYCFNYGSNAARHWDDDLGAIPETANDDRPVKPPIHWEIYPPELDYELSTYWSSGRTVLRSVESYGQTGWGCVFAYCYGSWEQQGDEVWDYGYFHLVGPGPGNYAIDIQDTDGDKYLRNLPINGEDDVTEEVGEIRAKLEIEGPANGDYHVTLSESSSKISLDPTTLSGTFDSEGEAERTFDVISTSSTPSAALEDIDITAELRETSQGDVEAVTTEAITAFRFLFAPLGNYTYHNPESSGHGSTDSSDFKVSAVTYLGNLREYAHLEEHFTMKVVDYPSGAFYGEVSARAEIEFHAKIYWYIVKGNEENDGTLSLSFDFGFVSVDLSSTGPDEVAGLAYDLAVKMPSDTEWHEYGGGGNAFDVSTREYTVGFLEEYDEWSGYVNPEQDVADGAARTYSVGDETQTHTVKLILDIATKTTDPWGAVTPDWVHGADAHGYIDEKEGYINTPLCPWLVNDTHVEDLDGVFEITETE